MKNKIKILTDKISLLREMDGGMLEGGFASIKGGFSAALLSTNDSTSGCTNSSDCTKAYNHINCVNTGTCFVQ